MLILYTGNQTKMSEVPISAPVGTVDPSQSQREIIKFHETPIKGSYLIPHNPDAAYPPETIGLTSSKGSELSVIAHISTGSELFEDGRMAIVSITGKNGKKSYGVQGLTRDGDGNYVAGENPAITIGGEGSTFVIGGSASGNSQKTGLTRVNWDALWKHGYGGYSLGRTSEGLSVQITPAGVLIRDTTEGRSKLELPIADIGRLQSGIEASSSHRTSGRTFRSLGEHVFRRLGIGMPKLERDSSLLGTKGRGSEYVSRQQNGSDFGYGNSEERLRALKKLSAQTLNQRLLAINNAVRSRGANDAEGEDGFTKSGRFASSYKRVPHVYPDAKDVGEVLDYALSAAQKAEDIQDAALILASGTVAAHPFADGNGRTSRAVYSELSMGLNPTARGYGMATMSTQYSRQEGGGSAMVNVGSGFLDSDPALGPVHKRLMYERAGIIRAGDSAAGYSIKLDSTSKRFDTLPKDYLQGLPTEKSEWLEDLYRNFVGTNGSGRDIVQATGSHESFIFAISYVDKHLPKRLDQYRYIPKINETLLSVDAIFASRDNELLTTLADGVREYYKQYALAYVDMLSKDSERQVVDPVTGASMSVKDRIVQQTNNFLSEKLTSRSLSLASKL